MKTDNYLSLCLDQAAKSPLHYRHGCIIVRGGKVIGQGYNDYRPGYDGGHLKNGRVANGALDGQAIADLKEKLKKQKDKPKEKQQHFPTSQHQHNQKSQTFVPFEGTGGGHGANTPLSMHSEMMAIHSALAASSTLSCSALSSKKPCFKLPSGDKRKARLRREALAAYVNAVCETATRAGGPQGHNNDNAQQQDEEQSWDDEDREPWAQAESRRVKERGLAFQAEGSGEKHHHQKKNGKKGKKNGKNVVGQYEGQYDRYGQHAQQQHRPSVSKKESGNGIRGYDMTRNDSMNTGQDATPGALQHEKHKKDYKRSGKMRTKHEEPPQPEPLLLPKGQTASSSRSVTDREKHHRLKGADVYVARLGWCRGPAERRPQAAPDTHTEERQDDDCEAIPSSTPSLSPTSTNTNTGSLHDEYLSAHASPTTPTPTPTPQPTPPNPTSHVRASRPCYRCITHMHTVGIKRVFWTNDAGAWEGGKIRDLVDALDKSMGGVRLDGGLGGPMGNGVFVTKHEVLMLKRMMGARGEG